MTKTRTQAAANRAEPAGTPDYDPTTASMGGSGAKLILRLIRYAEINHSRIALLARHDKNIRNSPIYYLVVRSNRPIRMTKTAMRQVQAASLRRGGFPCRYEDADAQFATQAEASVRFEAACLNRLTKTWNAGDRR